MPLVSGYIDKVNIINSKNPLTEISSSTSSTMPDNYTEGIDISHHQGTIDWSKLTPANSGKHFIIAKATEGATYQDPRFIEIWRNMSQLGFTPGAYHYLRFGTSTPKNQMKNFIQQLDSADKTGEWRHGIIALLVAKEEKNMSTDLVTKIVEESVKYLKDEYGVTPYIYTRQNYWNDHVLAPTPNIVKECPLWIAKWRQDPPSLDELPRGWDQWKIWQYSNKGMVPGINGSVLLSKMRVPPK